ncbi:MAG: Sulfurtransferase [Fimbriimonadales bacterium]|nr:Sulfurtransferase [Fimbriimonadales bacterium]
MGRSLEDFTNEARRVVREVDPEQVYDLVQGEGWLLLDVREPDEFAEGHLPGAINIPRGFLEVKADLEHYKRDERLQDRQQKVLCYCGGGHRSLLAAKTLLEMGFEDAVSMAGGWTEWTLRGFPTER